VVDPEPPPIQRAVFLTMPPAVILTSHREVPLSEGRMVLYTYSAPRRQPN
jgi:hypothetical protein